MTTPKAPMKSTTRPNVSTRAVAAVTVTLVTFVTPALALACPSARAAACGGCGGHSSLGSYLIAVGIGLLAGATSVGLEGRFRRRGNDDGR